MSRDEYHRSFVVHALLGTAPWACLPIFVASFLTLLPCRSRDRFLSIWLVLAALNGLLLWWYVVAQSFVYAA